MKRSNGPCAHERSIVAAATEASGSASDRRADEAPDGSVHLLFDVGEQTLVDFDQRVPLFAAVEPALACCDRRRFLFDRRPLWTGRAQRKTCGRTASRAINRRPASISSFIFCVRSTIRLNLKTAVDRTGMGSARLPGNAAQHGCTSGNCGTWAGGLFGIEHLPVNVADSVDGLPVWITAHRGGAG